jgi:outer membrane protein assembly factor BamB
MKTIFKAFWLIIALLSLNACRKDKDVSVENNKLAFVGTESGRFFAINPLAGSTLWSYTMNGGGNYWSSPAVSKTKVVYYNSDHEKLYCWNHFTGALDWSREIGYASYTSPLLVNDLLYATGDGKVWALNMDDGSVVKEINIPEGRYANSFNFVSNTLVVGTCGGHLYGLDPVTGMQKWEYLSNASCYHNNPAIANNTIYILSSGGKLSAVNATSGTEVWSSMINDYTNEDAPVVYNKGLLFLIGYDDSRVLAFDAKNGALKHTYTLPNQEDVYYNVAPAVEKGVLYILTKSNRLVAFSVPNEGILWQQDFATVSGGNIQGRMNRFTLHNRTFDASAASSVVVANETLFFIAEERRFIATDLEGAVLWELNLPDYTNTSAVILSSKDKVYRPGTAGVVQ